VERTYELFGVPVVSHWVLLVGLETVLNLIGAEELVETARSGAPLPVTAPVVELY
jgi:hypothetical protein